MVKKVELGHQFVKIAFFFLYSSTIILFFPKKRLE